MKINKFMALAVIALLAVSAMGFWSTQAYAQSSNPPAPQVQATQAPDNEQTSGADIDQVQEQVGDQTGTDTAVETGTEASEAVSSDGQDAAPTGTPAISADAAIQAAQAHLNTTASGKATLDDENGKLVYSVDLNGSDVKVDAMTGTVLGIDEVGGSQVDSAN